MHILHDEAYYASRKPQPNLGTLQNIIHFFYDSKRKAVLDRTCREWVEVTFFYMCFFSVLGALFTIQMYYVWNYVLQQDKPIFIRKSENLAMTRSFFENNFPQLRGLQFGSPGMGFNPTILTSNTEMVLPLVRLNLNTSHTRTKRYVDALSDLFQEYDKNKSKYDSNCMDGKLRSSIDAKPCFFDVKNFGVCSKPPYGYGHKRPMQPCVFLKFNKKFYWLPAYFNESSELPEQMPQSLRNIVKSTNKYQVWMSCDGQYEKDKQHIGEIEYIPSPGFPIQYFPFVGQPDYLSPMVALRFKNLTPRQLVTVECKLWAYNINRDPRYSLDFQIIIDE